MLHILRRISDVNREIIEADIAMYHQLLDGITTASIFATFTLALALAYLMVKTFMNRIKIIESNAMLVEQGMFEEALKMDATDEISSVFASLTGVFTRLIDEIGEVINENKKGNMNARINADHFRGDYKNTVIAINALLDVTAEMLEQQEKMQIAQANSQAKSRFLASMSHEIRTPLTAVLGIAEIQLHNHDLPLAAEESFAKIYSSANILMGIVNDILDLSRIEAGKMKLHSEKYNVANLLSDIAQINLAYLGSKELQFIINADENLPTGLIGDELRIKQVLNNLLSNAFKYTEEGSIYFEVCRSDSPLPGFVNIEIIIRDTGRGMNATQLNALFDEYARFHEKESRFEAGVGM